LNEKLFDRIDYLQEFIEKEASATEYMYNYPPKPGDDLTLESIEKDKDDSKVKNEGSVADKE
jgi:hypothetical protein